MNRSLRRVALFGCALLFAACASSQRPVFYPNAHLKSVGDATAQRDIDECMALAQSSQVPATKGVSGTGGTVAKSATVGAAAGAAAGAVRGNAGRGAATGAAGAGAAGLMHSMFKSRELDPVYKNFVDRCLRERGYDPIGWK